MEILENLTESLAPIIQKTDDRTGLIREDINQVKGQILGALKVYGEKIAAGPSPDFIQVLSNRNQMAFDSSRQSVIAVDVLGQQLSKMQLYLIIAVAGIAGYFLLWKR